MVIFFYFLCVFSLFISNTSIVRIHFGANLDAQNAGNDFLGEYTPRPLPPIHAWYIGHKRGLQPLLSPSNILSHRKVPFQKMPPHGKILKKGPVIYSCLPQKVATTACSSKRNHQVAPALVMKQAVVATF